MPIVPMARGRVAPTPVPGVRIDPSAPAGAFQNSPGIDLGPAIRVGQQIVEEQRAKDDQIAVLDADNQLSAATVDLKRAALARRGVDALGATADTREAWDKQAATIEAGLTSDRAKEIFRQRAARSWVDLYATVEQHADQEYRAHDNAVATEGINQRYNAALTAATPEARDVALQEMRAIITDHARRNGEADLAPGRVAAAVSRTHAGVLEAMVNSGQDHAAKDYLTAHRDELVGKDLIGAEHLLKRATVLGEAQRAADGIAKSALSLTAGLDAAAKIDDPEIRDDVERRVRQHFNDLAAADREAKAKAFTQASAIVEKTGSFDAIPLTLRMAMSPQDNEALQHRVDQIRHPKEPGDPETYFHLLNLASLSPQSRQQFLKEDLTPTGYPNLSTSERQKLMTLQRQLSIRADGATTTHLSREQEAEDQRNDHVAEAALRKTDPVAAEKLRAENFAKRQAKYHSTGAAPAGAAQPTVTGHPANQPLAGLLTPTLQPTRTMLDDIARKGEGYADYLRRLGYDIPAGTPTVVAPKP